MHTACMQGHVEVVKVLLSDSRIVVGVNKVNDAFLVSCLMLSVCRTLYSERSVGHISYVEAIRHS